MSRRQTVRRGVIEAVLDERDRQDDQWGPVPRDNAHWKWLPILMEEVGEVASEMLQDPHYDYDRLTAELVQVAAVAVAWVEELGMTDAS